LHHIDGCSREEDMKLLKYVLVATLAAVSLGCPTRSLYPLFTDKELEPLPAITGTWTSEKGDVFTFLELKDKSYDVVWYSKGEAEVYKAYLGKIGKHRFVDSYPGGQQYDHHLVQAHIITKIWLDGDSLHFASLESDWLKKMIESGKVQIPHVTLEGDIILTASTPELQQLVLRFADDDGAFPRWSDLVRIK
jgi:hypothetical protein